MRDDSSGNDDNNVCVYIVYIFFLTGNTQRVPNEAILIDADWIW